MSCPVPKNPSRLANHLLWAPESEERESCRLGRGRAPVILICQDRGRAGRPVHLREMLGLGLSPPETPLPALCKTDLLLLEARLPSKELMC